MKGPLVLSLPPYLEKKHNQCWTRSVLCSSNASHRTHMRRLSEASFGRACSAHVLSFNVVCHKPYHKPYADSVVLQRLLQLFRFS